MPESTCKHCLQEIKVAIFKGGDWCSENCRKILEKKREETLKMVEDTLRNGVIPADEVRLRMRFDNA